MTQASARGACAEQQQQLEDNILYLASKKSADRICGGRGVYVLVVSGPPVYPAANLGP